jgi:threonine dehydrogenase-like Zn-dependent dehydrogenase
MDLVISRELEIYGSHGMPARDYPEMLALIADQRLRPDLLVTKEIALEEAPAALTALDQPSATAGITVITSF